MNTDEKRKLTFQFFNEIGIIQQLSTTALNRKLPDGLHVAHFAVLNHLIRLGDGRTPQSISDAFQVTKGTMTHTLGALTKRNLIAIKPHPSDGRSKLVFITDAGRSFHSQAIESLNPFVDQLCRETDMDAVQDMLPHLQAIRAILDKNR